MENKIEKYLQINEGKHIDSTDLMFRFLPNEVIYSEQGKPSHYFRLMMTKTEFGFCLSYHHFLVEDDNEENCGMTDIWCNPFESYKVCNNLIEVKIEPPTNDEAVKAVRKVYGFLIEKDILK